MTMTLKNTIYTLCIFVIAATICMSINAGDQTNTKNGEFPPKYTLSSYAPHLTGNVIVIPHHENSSIKPRDEEDHNQTDCEIFFDDENDKEPYIRPTTPLVSDIAKQTELCEEQREITVQIEAVDLFQNLRPAVIVKYSYNDNQTQQRVSLPSQTKQNLPKEIPTTIISAQTQLDAQDAQSSLEKLHTVDLNLPKEIPTTIISAQTQLDAQDAQNNQSSLEKLRRALQRTYGYASEWFSEYRENTSSISLKDSFNNILQSLEPKHAVYAGGVGVLAWQLNHSGYLKFPSIKLPSMSLSPLRAALPYAALTGALAATEFGGKAAIETWYPSLLIDEKKSREELRKNLNLVRIGIKTVLVGGLAAKTATDVFKWYRGPQHPLHK